MKLCQDVCHHLILVTLRMGHVGSKTRSQGQVLEKTCVDSRWHSFDPDFMKLYQNVYLHQT